jgi:hypothetical protein
MRIESIAHQSAHRKYCASICAPKVIAHQHAHRKQNGASICASKTIWRINMHIESKIAHPNAQLGTSSVFERAPFYWNKDIHQKTDDLTEIIPGFE